MSAASSSRSSSPYAAVILESLARIGRGVEYDPRHVEAYMRLEHSTLDHLSAMQFDFEVSIACAAIELGGVDDAEALALTYFPSRCCAACAGTMSRPDGSRCDECHDGKVAL